MQRPTFYLKSLRANEISVDRDGQIDSAGACSVYIQALESLKYDKTHFFRHFV